jgi:ABC-type Mn2+/Zn2+ transport system permease subunit
MLACYVVLYGYAMGGNATLQASLVAEAFGRMHFGAIASRLAPFVVAAQALGVPATGYLRDVTGTFTPALMAIVLAALIAAGFVLQVQLLPMPGRRRPQRR